MNNFHFTATIGRNKGSTPMDAARWRMFKLVVSLELASAAEVLLGGDAYTDQWEATTGQWGGVPEDNYHCLHTAPLREGLTAHAVSAVLRQLRLNLRGIAWTYGQETIAVSYAVPGHESGAGLVEALHPGEFIPEDYHVLVTL